LRIGVPDEGIAIDPGQSRHDGKVRPFYASGLIEHVSP
jgi:hypothetical protein